MAGIRCRFVQFFSTKLSLFRTYFLLAEILVGGARGGHARNLWIVILFPLQKGQSGGHDHKERKRSRSRSKSEDNLLGKPVFGT